MKRRPLPLGEQGGAVARAAANGSHAGSVRCASGCRARARRRQPHARGCSAGSTTRPSRPRPPDSCGPRGRCPGALPQLARRGDADRGGSRLTLPWLTAARVALASRWRSRWSRGSAGPARRPGSWARSGCCWPGCVGRAEAGASASTCASRSPGLSPPACPWRSSSCPCADSLPLALAAGRRDLARHVGSRCLARPGARAAADGRFPLSLSALPRDPLRVLREYALEPLRRELRRPGSCVLFVDDRRRAEEWGQRCPFDAVWPDGRRTGRAVLARGGAAMSSSGRRPVVLYQPRERGARCRSACSRSAPGWATSTW